MAKLPEIVYRPVQAPTNAPGPGVAAAKARQVSQGFDVLTRGLTAINEETRKFNTTRAKVRTENAVTQAQDSVAGIEYFSHDDVRNMGLEDQVDLEAYPDAIPAEQVVPAFMSKTIDDAIETNSGTIRNAQDRNLWRQDMTYSKDEIMLKVNTAAGEAAMKREHVAQEVEILEAQRSGNFAGANELIDQRYRDPALRSKYKAENAVLEQDHKYSQVMMNGNPEFINAQADMLAALPPEDTPYDPKEQADMVKKLRTMAKSKEASNTEAYNNQYREWFHTNRENPEALLNPPRWMKPEHATKMMGMVPVETSEAAAQRKARAAVISAGELQELYDNNPAKFYQTDLMDYAGVVSTTDLNRFNNLQGEMKEYRSGKIPVSPSTSYKPFVDDYVSRFGITVSGDKGAREQAAARKYEYRRLAEDRLNEATILNGGKPLVQEQIARTLDTLYDHINSGVVQKSFLFIDYETGIDPDEMVTKALKADIPNTDYARIVTALRNKGVPVSDATVRQQYDFEQGN